MEIGRADVSYRLLITPKYRFRNTARQMQVIVAFMMAANSSNFHQESLEKGFFTLEIALDSIRRFLRI
jgi:hypothetical protein